MGRQYGSDRLLITITYNKLVHWQLVLAFSSRDTCIISYLSSLGSRSVDQRMVECFLVAIDCWDFLQSNITYRGGMQICVRVAWV